MVIWKNTCKIYGIKGWIIFICKRKVHGKCENGLLTCERLFDFIFDSDHITTKLVEIEITNNVHSRQGGEVRGWIFKLYHSSQNFKFSGDCFGINIPKFHF
jgi:hypothetical protein